MKKYDKLLNNKIIDIKKIKDYGFVLKNNYYTYEYKLNNNFKLIIQLNNDEFITNVYDFNINEEYLPIDIVTFNGKFVGDLREKRQNVINDIVNTCLVNTYNIKDLTKEVIKYVKEKYDSDMEYLWGDLKDAAIARNKNNNKWYLLIMKISKNKLDFEENEEVNIINLKNNDNMVDNKKIFPAYHMNKKKWITIILDNSINKEELFKLIDASYNLIENNK